MPLETPTTGYYTGLNLNQLLYQILFTMGQIQGTAVSYSKFPRKYIIEKLNDRQTQFVAHSHCLRRSAILQVKQDFKLYKLPSNCMDGGVLGQPKYYSSSTNYIDLKVRDTDWLDQNFQGWKVAPSSEPMYAYTGDSYGNIPMLGVFPAPDVDGTSYAISPDPGIMVGGDLPGTTSNIVGQATGGGATTLLDTVLSFDTLGLVSGIAIQNVTDGSLCYIQTVDDAHTITTTALAGGSDNLWQAGDSYNILAGEYGVITSWSGDESYIFSSEIGKIASITVPAGNIWIDYVPYPVEFPEEDIGDSADYLYPDIPKSGHMGLAMGVVADLLGSFNEKSKEFRRAQEFEGKFWKSVELATRKKGLRPFNNKPVRVVPMTRGYNSR